MPLPKSNSDWPPVEMGGMYAKMREWAAWYSGEPERIIDVYAAQSGSSTAAVPWWRFWSRARVGADGAQRALLHVPVAGDLASVSGALLFGEPPKLRIRPDPEEVLKEQAAEEEAKAAQSNVDNPFTDTTPEDLATVDAAAKAKATPKTSAEQKTEKRMLQIAEEGDLYARLVEAAESSAAIGGVYIYPVWDVEFRGVPVMNIVQSDMAVPEFQWGFLKAVTFHRVVERHGVSLWRHIERHEVVGTGASRKAIILNALYKGGETNLGVQAPLTDSEITAGLAPQVELPFAELDVEYLPNRRPNPLWRASSLGVADIQGSETLLDALDETYASWMRDIRLAKARIIVPTEYLRPGADGAPAFDLDQEVYVRMDMDPGMTQDARAMLAHQFSIRHEQHRATADNLVERIVSGAGYTPTTLGTANVSGTGTALRISEHKTLLTLRRKSGWWRTAIANTLMRMMLLDAEVFGSGIEAIRPTVLTSDSIIDNPLELAQTALAMKTAEASSVETRVRILHPDWSAAEVAEEVARVKDDLETAKPVTVSRGQFGNPDDDPASTQKKPKGEQPSGPPPTNPPPPQATKKPA